MTGGRVRRVVLAAIRIAIGLLFASEGIRKLLDHDAFVSATRDPLPAGVRGEYEHAMPVEHVWLGLQRARERELVR